MNLVEVGCTLDV